MRPRLFQRGRIFLPLCAAQWQGRCARVYRRRGKKILQNRWQAAPRGGIINLQGSSIAKKAVLLPDIISTVGGALWKITFSEQFHSQWCAAVCQSVQRNNVVRWILPFSVKAVYSQTGAFNTTRLFFLYKSCCRRHLRQWDDKIFLFRLKYLR